MTDKELIALAYSQSEALRLAMQALEARVAP
jgi:hypothetical protein